MGLIKAQKRAQIILKTLGGRTLSLDEDAEQRMGRRHGFAEVVVVVDGQQVTVDVGVADHHLHVGDAVDVQNELVELLKLPRLGAVHREPAEFCPVLRRQEWGGG